MPEGQRGKLIGCKTGGEAGACGQQQNRRGMEAPRPRPWGAAGERRIDEMQREHQRDGSKGRVGRSEHWHGSRPGGMENPAARNGWFLEDGTPSKQRCFFSQMNRMCGCGQNSATSQDAAAAGLLGCWAAAGKQVWLACQRKASGSASARNKAPAGGEQHPSSAA